MTYVKTKTRFTTLTRISPENLKWIQEHKDTRTVAGYLDKIINNYKNKKCLQHQSNTELSQVTWPVTNPSETMDVS